MMIKSAEVLASVPTYSQLLQKLGGFSYFFYMLSHKFLKRWARYVTLGRAVDFRCEASAQCMTGNQFYQKISTSPSLCRQNTRYCLQFNNVEIRRVTRGLFFNHERCSLLRIKHFLTKLTAFFLRRIYRIQFKNLYRPYIDKRQLGYGLLYMRDFSYLHKSVKQLKAINFVQKNS